MIQFLFITFILLFNNQGLAGEYNNQAEIQWSICEDSPSDFLDKINENFDEKSIQQISYLDTPDLYYVSQGIVFRFIRKKDDKIKSTSKVEIRNENIVDWDWLAKQEHKCELNVYQNLEKKSCSIDNKIDDSEHLNKKQIEMVERVGGIRFNDEDHKRLIKFGPLTLNRWKSKKKDLTFEFIDIPGLGQSMELSLRVPEGDRHEVLLNLNRWLSEKGVRLCERQDSRTEIILKALRGN